MPTERKTVRLGKIKRSSQALVDLAMIYDSSVLAEQTVDLPEDRLEGP